MALDRSIAEEVAQAEARAAARVRRQIRRKPIPPILPHDHNSALWAHTVMALWPWRRGEYPGYSNCAAAAFGLERDTVSRYRYPGVTVSARVALRVAAYLRSKAQQLLDLAAAWDAHATTQAARPVRRPFREQRLAEVDGWRSKPRTTTPKAPRKPRVKKNA